MFSSGTVEWETKLEGRVECSAAIVDDFSQVLSHATLPVPLEKLLNDVGVFFCRLLLDVTKEIFTFFTFQMAMSAGVLKLMERYGNTLIYFLHCAI